MFCYQCQEAARNTGCTFKGICGKTAEIANLQYAALEMTKVLSYWNTEARKFHLDNRDISHFVINILFATITNANFDDAWFMEQIKYGATLRQQIQESLSQYDKENPDKELAKKMATYPKRVYWNPLDSEWTQEKLQDYGLMHNPLSEANEDIRSLQELTFYGLKGMAAYVDHAYVLGYEDPEIYAFMEEKLTQMIESPAKVDFWVQNTLKTGEFGVTAMALLDKANTSTFGHPEPTEVSLGVKEGPGILISGHDLLDLKELLEQTEGKGINIYTHGEMLPANAYPELKKYPHLVGNYGGSWWHQNKEFATFNGPILLTTNCLVPPKDTYLDRLYTTGNVGWPNVPHIPDRKAGTQKDFSSIIARALETSTPDQLEDKKITIGFAHNSVLSRAGDVIELIKAGDIKRFVVMAGCDGRMKNRGYFTDVAQNLPKDTIILTAGCAKYRYNKLDLGDIKGIPRVLDAGQCNDSYSLAVIALKLAEAFGTESINDLPLSFDIAWYEQKAVLVLLALLHLGVKKIRLGPTLPAFLSPNVIDVLVKNFDIKPTDSVLGDIEMMMAGN